MIIVYHSASMVIGNQAIYSNIYIKVIFGRFIKSEDNLEKVLKMILVNLQLAVKPDQLEAMKTRFINEVLPDTRNYSGCNALYMTENIDIPNQVEFISIWDSKEHYDTYLNWREETGLLDEMAEKYLERDPIFRFLNLEKEF